MRALPRGLPGYEARRRAAVWNGRRPARRPHLILVPRTAAEVPAAVREARSRGLAVAVRGGGHSWGGAALRDGGALIDLSRLDRLEVDAGRRVAWAGPAVTGRGLMRRLAPHALAFPAGHHGDVALSGYVLSGGFGWNAAVWGPACAGLRAVRAVTAGGEAVEGGGGHEDDLLWAARGGGPAVPAVVTGLRLDLRPAPARIARVARRLTGPDASAAPEWLARLARELPPEVELTASIAPGPAVGVSATAFSRSLGGAEEALAPLAAGGPRPRETSFAGLYATMDRVFPAGRRYAADALWSDAPLPAMRAALAAAAEAPSPASFILVSLAPGLTVPPGGALSVAGAAYLACYAIWDRPEDDAANIAWARRAAGALRPHAHGRYVGEADLYAGPIEDCFSPGAWRRLREIRAARDPDGVLQPPPGAPSSSP